MSVDILFIPKLLSIKDRIAQDLATGLSAKNIIATITDPNVLDVLEKLGETMFPKVAPEIRVVAAISMSFDTNGVKFAQNVLNRLVVPSPGLIVDGHTGPKTQAAIAALQTMLGINPDEYFGEKTLAGAMYLLSKMEAATLVTPVTQPEALPPTA